ncbi:MAG: alpha/beta hydrolase [Gammaproteobacteria bacterium]|nr:alpha/beta hydrolase [Gammaproteobacteria bacterium]MBU1481579.1 alpha/beta hydrolase [Gammaproteobacteria bacterium]
MMQLQTQFIHDIAPDVAGERILLLMLPGAKNTPQQLVDYGFIRELRERRLPVDVLALDAHVDLYLERADIERVLHHTLDEARTHGYRRIWLLGISLGGSGAMICATQRTADIEGIFLLAPFLGTRGIIAEVEAAGGLQHWRAGEIGMRDHERMLLEQIQCITPDAGGFPPIYLGYGSEDRYRGASIMLAEGVPQARVSVAPGGHDWETWIVLWRRLLGKQPFAV